MAVNSICIIAAISEDDINPGISLSTDMLELLSLRYQPATSSHKILRDITLVAKQGQPCLITGASGSGKTTLLEVIAGLNTGSGGHIRWKGSLVNSRQRRWLCGMVFQFPERHFLGLTVAQELLLGQRRLDAEHKHQVLRRVGLDSLDLRLAPEQLSGGQQRRLALAVQILRHPGILLLDEPTAGLDWQNRHEILNLLNIFARDLVMVVATHEPELFLQWNCLRHQLLDGLLIPMPTSYPGLGTSNG
ncbi:ABC transporter ATP-binding protein [cyanobiont of Ornithocercus magnificus]|nr:ABC transporter ATP-binding protein [cyanobiont of Ornithocercus magnificus]